MKKTYIAPLCEDLTLTTPGLMQGFLDVLDGSGNRFNDESMIE